MLSRTFAGTTVGVCGLVISVEVDLSAGLPGITIVGLPDASIQESRERIRAAVRNSGLQWPLKRITVNLAPAVVRKEGVSFDLAIACAILAASEQIPQRELVPVMCGELGLDGSLRAVRGALALAADLERLGHRELIVPAQNAPEAAMVRGVTVRPAASLRDVVLHFADEQPLSVQSITHDEEIRPEVELPDLADVRGQPAARRALEVAAAGHHNLLLTGPPGSGKTMLASRMPSILPPASFGEALEITRVHSVAGQLSAGQHWVATRPVRAPHHTMSDIALVGGGPRARPGEVSLAHRGILFLDELPEFKRAVLEALRQPLVDGAVTVSRAQATYRYPADFMLIAAMNPCPCGYLGDPGRLCRCTTRAIDSYRARISGPLLDRMDLIVEVPRVGPQDLDAPAGQPSEVVRQRVVAARARQAARQKLPPGSIPAANGRLSASEIRRHCGLSTGARKLLSSAAQAGVFSARAYEKVLKVALTIADLEASDQVVEEHVAEAIAYRSLELTPGVRAA